MGGYGVRSGCIARPPEESVRDLHGIRAQPKVSGDVHGSVAGLGATGGVRRRLSRLAAMPGQHAASAACIRQLSLAGSSAGVQARRAILSMILSDQVHRRYGRPLEASERTSRVSAGSAARVGRSGARAPASARAHCASRWRSYADCVSAILYAEPHFYWYFEVRTCTVQTAREADC